MYVCMYVRRWVCTPASCMHACMHACMHHACMHVACTHVMYVRMYIRTCEHISRTKNCRDPGRNVLPQSMQEAGVGHLQGIHAGCTALQQGHIQLSSRRPGGSSSGLQSQRVLLSLVALPSTWFATGCLDTTGSAWAPAHQTSSLGPNGNKSLSGCSKVLQASKARYFAPGPKVVQRRHPELAPKAHAVLGWMRR